MKDNEELGLSLHMESISSRGPSFMTSKRMEGTRYVQVYDNGVAKIDLVGPIYPRANMMTDMSGATSVSQFTNDFIAAYQNAGVTGIVMDIDSPGGDARGIGDAALLINRLSQSGRKPVKAFASGYMASAAYYLGSTVNEIVGSKSSITGSVGVVLTMRSKEKGEIEIVSSQSPNKRPDPETDEGRSILQQKVDDLAQIFIEDVAKFRGITPERVMSHYGQGDTMIGPRAKKHGLVDKIGTLGSTVEEVAREAEKPKGTKYSFPSQSYEATEGTIPSILQFTEEEDMGLKNLVAKFRASEETTIDAQAQDAENLESGTEASEGQQGETVTPSAGTIEPTVEGVTEENVQATVTREQLEEQFSDSAELFAVTLTTRSKIFPAQQAHAASQLINAKIDDFMFGGSISFVNEEGVLTEGTREAAVRAMYEAMPKHSMTQNAISGIKDNTVTAVVLPESDTEMVAVDGPISEERRRQLLGMTELGQKAMRAAQD